MELRCIKCGEESCIKLDLADGVTLSCPECDAEYEVNEVRQVCETWMKLVNWIDHHPARTTAKA